MKIKEYLFVAALLSLGLVSCQKDDKVITQFNAGMEQSADKTHLDGELLKWDDGEQVMVYSDGANGSPFTAARHADNHTWATLSGSISVGEQYTAIYPMDAAASSSSVILPVVQTSPDGSLVNPPMYAQSSTNTFHFKNLCGALKIQLQQSDVTISRIKVTTSTNITGTYDIDATGDEPLLTNCTDGSGSTILTLATPQPVADGHAFYISLPAGEYTNMQLTFYQPNGTSCTLTGSVSIYRSVCTRITINGGLVFPEPPEGTLPSYYSVSPTLQVLFTRGNLVATTADGSTTWSLHENQYDMLDNANNVESQCDLFGWSTSSTQFGLNNSLNYNDYLGEFVEWGTRFRNGEHWRTLSYSEWDYLLTKRAASTVNGTPNARYALISLENGDNDIRGMLLFPDEFTWPEAAGDPPTVINNTLTTGNWNNAPVYTMAQFQALENEGRCAFLPASGFRYGTEATIYRNNIRAGYYWSASPATEPGFAYYMLFSFNRFLTTGTYDRSYGMLVRLVYDVTPVPARATYMANTNCMIFPASRL